MQKTAIIVSSGRTGTHFLAQYFSANYPGVIAAHEPRPRQILRFCSNLYTAGRLSPAGLARVLTWSRQKKSRRMQADNGVRCYIESNPFLYGFAGVLDAVWTAPMVIHVVRDPRAYVTSSLNHGNTRGLKWLLGKFMPFWLPDGRRFLAAGRTASPLGIAASHWRVVNETITESAACVTGYHRFYFEELFDDSFSGLRRLCELLDLDFIANGTAVTPQERTNASRDRSVGKWQTWTAAQCREVHDICMPMMADFGYGGEDAWQEQVRKG